MSERIDIKVLWRAARTPAEREAVLQEACARGRELRAAHSYDPSRALKALKDLEARSAPVEVELPVPEGRTRMEQVYNCFINGEDLSLDQITKRLRQPPALVKQTVAYMAREKAAKLRLRRVALGVYARATALLMLLAGLVQSALGQTNAPLPMIPTLVAAPVSPVPPKLDVTLLWNHSPDADVKGYRIYCSNTKSNPDWKPFFSVGYTNQASAAITNWPMWFTCTATNADGGESAFSNVCGVLGHDTRATVWSEVSGGPGQAFHFLAVVTNTPATGQEFYRLGISNHTKLRTE